MNRNVLSFPADAPNRRNARSGAGVLALSLAAVLVAPSASHAAPDDMDIDELNEKAEELEETYEGELLQFNEIKERAEQAQEDLKEVEEQLEGSRSSVVQIAASQYKSSGLDPTLEVLFTSSPENLFQDTSTMEQLGRQQAGQISELVELQETRKEIAEEAEKELSEAEELIATLEEDREEVEEAIERYEAEQVPEPPEESAAPSGGGTIPERLKGWGFDGATPRMAAIRDEIILNVGSPYEVGCARSSNDDHGTGQACDFMVSVIGTHPSAENRATGNAIAQYAIDNVDRLGVKYVIWEQRIWHSTNRQWVAMNNRGSITENHYDHVHISSY
ncbi:MULTISPECIES: coiled-coil domain-containing protein [Nocardiopsis]|uniref:ARB-07466-like C-terminal domain-containing protein n=1 Tax=Nocardiopsis sinuspersici TaxID=501010 RepID=A0A1V3BXW7_9ACTN|nr:MULTISPECIES: hypothetical protein [Nocardiopsis]OOC53288.1 hypothetical protein NOSIN_05235 [Nocardiopsis sinuspersici]